MFKLSIAALTLLALISTGCKSSGSSDSSSASSETKKAEVEKPKAPIPPDSRFAKVKEGMGFDEVCATIGQPTSTNHYMTGKSFIPFHYGGDNTRMTAHYKGIGTITFSQNSAFTSGMSAISIDYDPNEPGFERNQ